MFRQCFDHLCAVVINLSEEITFCLETPPFNQSTICLLAGQCLLASVAKMQEDLKDCHNSLMRNCSRCCKYIYLCG